MTDVLVIGGGLAGLFNAILLNRAGLNVTLVEKNQYPFHRVCGEYISNEVIPFLENQNLYPSEYHPAKINRLEISATSGHSFTETLSLGGFGISRHTYDHWLSQIAIEEGVKLIEKTTVTKVEFAEDSFLVTLNTGKIIESKYVIGAFGKRSKLDQTLDRSFLKNRSPYVGVKYHIKVEADEDLISLHNFKGGYCGMSMIEEGKFNLCYLTHRDLIRKHGSIVEMEQEVLMKNPHLKRIFSSAEFLFDNPEVINEISFDKQEPIFNYIFMCGDSAGMITPLCGNGMAMAIRSAAMLSSLIVDAFKQGTPREQLEQRYRQEWETSFKTRLWFGQKIQRLFGSGTGSNIGVLLGKLAKPITRYLIQQTHGEPFS